MMVEVTCGACTQVVGHACTLAGVDDVLYRHDPHCSATPDRKRQAILNHRLTTYTAQEGQTYE